MGHTEQLNVEYFLRLLYDCLHGACYGNPGIASLFAWFAHLWIVINVIGYTLSAAALFVIVYCMVRIYELRKREEEYYGTLILAPESAQGPNPRWRHIEALASGDSPSGWREAIIEADIMLDDMLARQGYAGASVADKLKQVERSDMDTLEDAWEAHKVRNQIAHEGSAFDLSQTLAQRTIARFERVFREFDAI